LADIQELITFPILFSCAGIDVYSQLQTLWSGQAQLPGGKPGLFCGRVAPAADIASSGDEHSGPAEHHTPGAPPDDIVYVEEDGTGSGSPTTSTSTTTTGSTTTVLEEQTSEPTEQPTMPAPPAEGAAAAAAQWPPRPSSPASSALLARQGTCRSTLRGFALTGPMVTSVTLCPLAFDTTDRAPTLNAITVTQGKVLDACDARSQTLLHEGIHIMLRGHNSPDTACKTYPLCSLRLPHPFLTHSSSRTSSPSALRMRRMV
jgi:hypothetical protein